MSDRDQIPGEAGDALQPAANLARPVAPTDSRMQNRASLPNRPASHPNPANLTAASADGARVGWQSRIVLLCIVPPAAVYAFIQILDVPSLLLLAQAAGISLAFAVLVLLARAATPAAASLGALLALCYALTPGYPHSPLWGLAATLVLTLGASRIGRARKQHQGTAEPRSGRTAAQVAANLGVGALAGAAINSHGMLLAQAAMLAALGEATADTLASELGQLASAPPRLLLTGRRVLPGTDGAVSLPGTAAGLLGAMLIALVVHWAFALPWPVVSLALAAAVAGLLLDSVFGQLFELRGWLGNDAVNFLSTLSAALLTLTLGRILF